MIAKASMRILVALLFIIFTISYVDMDSIFMTKESPLNSQSTKIITVNRDITIEKYFSFLDSIVVQYSQSGLRRCFYY